MSDYVGLGIYLASALVALWIVWPTRDGKGASNGQA